MKSFIVLTVLCICAVLADDPHGIKAAHKKCHPNDSDDHSAELPPDHGEEAHQNHNHPPHNVEQLVCVAKELGLVNADGAVNKEEIKKHAGHVLTDAAAIDNIATECAVNKDTVNDTVEGVWKCLHKNNIFGHGGHDDHAHHHDHSHD